MAVSTDPAAANRDFAAGEVRRHGAARAFGFPLLSDPGGRAAAAYGVVGSECARRATFVLDERGVVRHVEEPTRFAEHGRELADRIRALRQTAPPR